MKNYLIAAVLFLTALHSSAQLKAVAYKDGTQKLNGFAAIPEKNTTNVTLVL